jgi:ribose transport system substrate-binding protein
MRDLLAQPRNYRLDGKEISVPVNSKPYTRTSSTLHWATAVCLAAIATAALAACGSSSSSTSSVSNTASANAASATPTGVQTATARFAASTKPPQIVAPAPNFDAAKARGKTAWLINISSSFPIVKYWLDPAEAALRSYGVKVVEFDANGEPQEFNRGVAQALSANANAIFTLSIPPTAIKTEVAQARSQGVPVIASTDGNPDAQKNADYVPGIKAEVSYDYDKVGRLEADWFISDSKGKGHALFISNDDLASAYAVTNGFRSEVSELCPSCQVTVKDVPSGQVPTVLPTLVSTTLQRDPSIDYVVPDFDFQVPVIASQLRQSNLIGHVKIGSWNAQPSVMALLKQPNSGVDMDMGAPNDWFGYAIADAVLRQLTGSPAYNWGTAASNFLGIRTFTPENVTGIDVSKYDDLELYGVQPDQLDRAYRAIWGAKTS